MKRTYIAPQIDIIHCEHLCEYIPVHFSIPGTGVVDGKETEFEEEGDSNGWKHDFGSSPRRSEWDDFDR